MRSLFISLALAGTIGLFAGTAYVVSLAIQPRGDKPFTLTKSVLAPPGADSETVEIEDLLEEDLDADDRRVLQDILKQRQ